MLSAEPEPGAAEPADDCGRALRPHVAGQNAPVRGTTTGELSNAAAAADGG